MTLSEQNSDDPVTHDFNSTLKWSSP